MKGKQASPLNYLGLSSWKNRQTTADTPKYLKTISAVISPVSLPLSHEPEGFPGVRSTRDPCASGRTMAVTPRVLRGLRPEPWARGPAAPEDPTVVAPHPSPSLSPRQARGEPGRAS